MLKLSIIIPVYNTEKHIKKCLESLVKQKMQDFEIVVVNDGSTDNSEQIIQDYISNNQNIKIKYYKKENGGLSSARNYGVEKAIGKYISFIDSDDYIDENLYKNLEKYMDKNIELIKFKMQTVNEKGKVIKKIEGPVFEEVTGQEAFSILCTEDYFLEVACIYLYKTEFFIQNNFQYKVGAYHEDFGLTPLIIVQAKTVVSTNEYGYYYLQTENSIMRNKDYKKTIKKVNDVLEQYDEAIKTIENIKITKKTEELIKRYYTNTIIIKAKELEKKEFSEYIKKLKNRKIYKNIVPYNLKQYIKRIILRINISLYLKIK